MLIRKIAVYDYGSLSLAPIGDGGFLKDKFYIAIPSLSAIKEEKTLLHIEGALSLRVILRSFDGDTADALSLKKEECFYYNDKNEFILEAVCQMRTADGAGEGEYILRMPLSAPSVQGGFAFVFDGTWLRFVKDGEVLNENSGLDAFLTPDGAIFVDPAVSLLVSPVTEITRSYREEKSNAPMDFYYPHGFNTSIGDVMNFAHDGRYHAIYLLDRRHHGSRDGCGAHYLAHLVTDDLINWYEVEPVVEIDEPWVTYGTGTMLYQNGKHYMTFGYHSERYAGACEKIEPKTDECGAYHPVSIAEIRASGALPAGASYAESEDGIHFTRSDILFHAGRNPSAYVDEKGEIDLFIGYGGDGCFHGKTLNAAFGKSNLSFPYAKRSLMKNTTECPSFFTFNGYKYLIVGFTGYYRTASADSSDYVDASALGECIYDGLGVPMVAALGDRRIMAGWLGGPMGWGGAMMHRELLFEAGGALGMRWVPEMVPEALGEPLVSGWDGSAPMPLPEKESYILSFSLVPDERGFCSLVFSDGEKKAVLWIDAKKERAGFADTEEADIPTAMEQLRAVGDTVDIYPQAKLTDIPRNAHNYTLSNIKGTDGVFPLRLICRYSRRMRATVLDVEIAQRRTMVSVRGDFYPTGLACGERNGARVLGGTLSRIFGAE